jgi:hypothetical protein
MRNILVLILALISLPAWAGMSERMSSAPEAEFARWIRAQHREAAAASVIYTHTTTMLPMEDGVKLYTSIYVPTTGGTYPTILERTPYNEVLAGEDSYSYSGIADYYAPKGYAVVIQTIRGKYSSEGTYRLFSTGEIDDAFTTINWIAGQSWSNGKVGIMGVSHDGLDALAAGVRNPAPLKVIISGGAPTDLRTDAFLGHGVLSVSALDYIAFMSTEQGQVYDQKFFQDYLDKTLSEPRVKTHDNIVELVQLPLWDELITQLNTPFSPYWKTRSFRDRLTAIRVPVIHIAGLTGDGDMPDTVRNYLAMIQNSETKPLQRLILGWWPHGGSAPYGNTRNVSQYLLTRIDAYLAYYLQNKTSQYLKEKPLQAYSKGQEKWVYADQWPITAQSQQKLFYLSNQRKLSNTVPGSSLKFDSYTCNPVTVPSLLTKDVASPGPDQALFFSDPMPKDTYILGDGSVRIFASADTTDADFVALLFVRSANGSDLELASQLGRIQARFRNGDYTAPSLIQPNQIYEYNMPLYPISSVVKKGDRIGLLILSNFTPYVVRNANTGKKIGTDTAFKTAHIKVYHSSQYPSAVTLVTR